MQPLRYRFDAYLQQVPSNDLKAMVRLWGGRSQLRKDECIAIIRQGLGDPARVRSALASLNVYELTALALVKQMGGVIEATVLAAALRATGVGLPRSSRPAYDDTVTLIQPLIHRGLLLGGISTSIGTAWDPTRAAVVFADERLLASIASVECVPLTLPAAPSPTSSTYRLPSTVLLDMLGVLQAIATLGGLRLTKAGTPRTGDIRKLAHAMHWQEPKLDGLAVPVPVHAWLDALREAGLLIVRGDTLELRAPLDQLVGRSYVEPARALLYGFSTARNWSELETADWYGWETRLVAARLALLLMLTAVSVSSEGFFTIDALDQALFERLGEHFSLRYPPRMPYFFHKAPEEVRREEAVWRTKLRTDWLGFERHWLIAALGSWLYALGIVELGWEGEQLASLRLTALGQAVLHPAVDEHLAVPVSPQAAWIVQPNFEVQVFLDQITPESLAFLERHAERVQTHIHTAQYRLTREAVYRSLESGTSLDDLVSGLQHGVALPQNVEFELRSWAALREQIRLRQRARLLEYPDEQLRHAALAQGLPGTAVGDRFVLLEHGTVPVPKLKARLDYAGSLPRCLTVTEDGVITLGGDTPDLLIRAHLDRWAEPLGDRTWRITATTIAARLKAGTRSHDLFNLFKDRLTHPLPPLLGLALQAWTGAEYRVGMAPVTVLRCRQPAVLEAIRQSETLRPYIRDTLAPDVLLVDTQHMAALQERLQWAGIDVSEVLDVSRWPHKSIGVYPLPLS